MSFTLVERANSRSYSLVPTPGESSITLQYLMTWSDASTQPTEAQILSAASPPPKRISSAVYSGNSYLKTMVIREVSIEPVRERQNAWIVTHRASTRNGTLLDQDGSYCSCTRATVVRSTAMYRKDPTFPSNGTVAFSAGADIAGLKVDTNGKPKVYDVPQQLVTIETQYDRTLPQGSPAAEPLWSVYTSYVGNRNSAVFLGFPIGTLLYQGFQTAPEDNYYRMSHTFLYDAWYHLDQIPAPNPTGEPVLVAGVTIGGIPILQVDKVVFLQRYDTLSAFSGILSALDLAALTNPKPLAIA